MDFAWVIPNNKKIDRHCVCNLSRKSALLVTYLASKSKTQQHIEAMPGMCNCTYVEERKEDDDDYV